MLPTTDLLQHNLYLLSRWSANNRLTVNRVKSLYLRLGKGVDGRTYTLAGKPLHPTPTKNLGVISHCDLKSVNNMSKLYGNGLRMLWALKRSFCIWPEEIATRLCHHKPGGRVQITRLLSDHMWRGAMTGTCSACGHQAHPQFARCAVRRPMETTRAVHPVGLLVYSWPHYHSSGIVSESLPHAEATTFPCVPNSTRGHCYKL
ncbi:unnamed protein product, partial [Dicrocoelium dendriticum]